MNNSPIYKLLNIILLESNFAREAEIKFTDPGFKSDINLHLDNQAINNQLFTTLTVNFWAGIEEHKEIKAEIKMLGIFEYSDESNLSIDEFGKINAPAIIFPFIREHLASLSSKAGINPILLPPINFVKLSEYQKNN